VCPRWVDYFVWNSITSLSLRTCSSPITCPPNLLEGPQTLARLIFFDIPFRIFSAASLKVDSFLIIIGSLLGSFFGSLVYILIIGNVLNIFCFSLSNSNFEGSWQSMIMWSYFLNLDFRLASIFLFS